ncbi:hypothetical protein M0804_004141 [Polistes exclamans]|nr:hypothetical protein M0804_004141 [Polistes exclamans]
MNQAEQTLNFEIRCRRTRATAWQRGGGSTSKYTFAITIPGLYSWLLALPSFPLNSVSLYPSSSVPKRP